MSANQLPLPAPPWVPFVGSGISIHSGLPLVVHVVDQIVQPLLEKFANDLGAEADKLKGELLKVRMELVLEAAEEASPEKSLLQEDSDVFDPWFRAKPNAVHKKIGRWLGDETVPAVFTTNIDNLIEQAYSRTRDAPPLDVVTTDAEFAKFHRHIRKWQSHRRPVLFKLHGSLGKSRQSKTLNTIQMSVRQLSKIADLSGRFDVLNWFTRKYPFVFAGYSGCDDFDLFPLLMNMRGRQRWVWLSHAASSNGAVIDHSVAAPLDRVEALMSAPPTRKGALWSRERVFGRV